MRTISAYEHMTLPLRERADQSPDYHLEEGELEALARYHAREPRYFSLVHKGIKLKHWVGLLRVGSLQIEVLPKLARKASRAEIPHWRNFLMDMLVRAGLVSYHELPNSLTGTRNTMLDLLLWHYLAELEQALHQGLIKRYRRAEGNRFALKGKLLFGHQMRHNLVHQERFYTAHTVYDFDHELNQLLAAAVQLVPVLSKSLLLRNRAAQLCMELPPVSEVSHPERLWTGIRVDRKSAPFAGLITLARLLVENHHPTLSTGQQETFSLMFDMNAVFEAWLRVELTSLDGVEVTKPRLNFLRFDDARSYSGIPDLVVRYQGQCYVLDAKWKRWEGLEDVSVADLRQVYTYLHLQEEARAGGLIYPMIQEEPGVRMAQGIYHHPEDRYRFPCHLIQVAVALREGALIRLNRGGVQDLLLRMGTQAPV